MTARILNPAYLARVPGPAYLWISFLVFAASSSIVRILSDLGAMHPIDGRKAIQIAWYAGLKSSRYATPPEMTMF